MNSDVKYVLKRIFVGVAIGVLLMLIKGAFIADVNALTSVPITVSDTDASQVINSNTRSITYGGNWNVMGFFNGYVVGSFSIIKSTNTSVEPIITPRYVLAMSSTARYTCEIGSTTANNSTYVSQTYTYKCPVSFGDVGLDGIVVGFNGQQLQNPSVFIVDFVNRLNFYNEEPNINFDTSGTTNAINNQINNDNSNTQSIINNENQNTQSIINNQNSNTDKEIESQKVCTVYDKNAIKLDNSYIGYTGTIGSNNNIGVTDYINILNSDIKVLFTGGTGFYLAFYDVNKNFISSFANNNLVQNENVTIPDNANYVRFSINKNSNRPQFSICTNGNQAISNSVNDLNNTLNDDSIDSNTGSEFFGDFNYGDDTLSAVITAPLRFFNKLTDTCQPITLTYLNQNIVIPCGDTIFWNRQDVSSFRIFWNLLFGGVAIYYLSTKLYKVVHNSFDPQKDNIESVGV